MKTLLAAVAFLMSITAAAAAPALHIVALGDSLTAGLGLPAEEAFPARLEAALKARGHDVTVSNAGVSGDTVQNGLDRLDWALADGADAVIVELGANDMLRGVEPEQTRRRLDTLLGRIDARGIPMLVAGMQAAPNLGADYVTAYNAIFPDLAAKYHAVLYPFFLDGVAGEPRLNQPDGEHPTAEGVDIIVERILPSVEALIARIPKS